MYQKFEQYTRQCGKNTNQKTDNQNKRPLAYVFLPPKQKMQVPIFCNHND